MIILGLTDSADAAAALLVDGVLAAAAIEAPLLRRPPIAGQLPSAAIDAVLDRAGVKARDVDRVIVAGTFTPGALARAGVRPASPSRFDAFIRKSGLHMLEQDACERAILPKLTMLGLRKATLTLLEHDRCHATAAFRAQDHDPCLVLTLDTPGDGVSASVSVGENGQLDRLWLQSDKAAIATFSQRISRILDGRRLEGHGPGVPGRPLDRFPRGRPGPLLDRDLRFEATGFSLVPTLRGEDPLGRMAPEDLAATAQDTLEAAVSVFVLHHVAATGIRDVAVVGEVFRNRRLCGVLAALPAVRSLFVFPEPGDASLAIGAALYAGGVAGRRLANPALGPTWTEDAAYKALSNASLPRRRVDDPEAEIAALLLAGKVVLRHAGPLEFSPSGLGNRSILAPPDHVAVGSRAGPAWDPGAAILAEEAEAAFPGLSSCWDAARFQAVSLVPTSAFATENPATVRGDGRVDVHVVTKEDDPTLHQVLTLYRRGRGRGVVAIGTLFDAEGRVAASPLDAVREWRRSEADALVVGPYLLVRGDS